MRRNYKLERLENGETFVTNERGNSMVPLIHSGEDHTLEPATIDDIEVGDIVYCKVKGNFYTHLVKAKDAKKGCLIGNKTNFWESIKVRIFLLSLWDIN